MKDVLKSSTYIQDMGHTGWLVNDPRSVSAMLRGIGDRRELLYNEYAEKLHKRRPSIEEDELMRSYSRFAQKHQFIQQIRLNLLIHCPDGRFGTLHIMDNSRRRHARWAVAFVILIGIAVPFMNGLTPQL